MIAPGRPRRSGCTRGAPSPSCRWASCAAPKEEKGEDAELAFTRYPKKPTQVAAPSPRASLRWRTVCGRTEQRRSPVSKRYETKVRMVWGSFRIAAAALKTPTRNCYNAQGPNLTFRGCCARINMILFPNTLFGWALHYPRNILSPPPIRLSCTMYRTILVVTISCKGQTRR